MAVYDYVCKCGYEEEIHHSIKEDPVIKCKKCKKVMERSISGGAGVVFNGSGFYETDYKQKNK
jgi:putative FmdB family regulatory protein